MKKKTVKKIPNKMSNKNVCKTNSSCDCSGSGLIYFMIAIGTAIYYILNSTGFLSAVFGIVKGILWPAFLIFEVLTFLGA